MIVALAEPLDLTVQAFFVFWVVEGMAWVVGFNLFINEENCFLFLAMGGIGCLVWSDLWKFGVICGNLE